MLEMFPKKKDWNSVNLSGTRQGVISGPPLPQGPKQRANAWLLVSLSKDVLEGRTLSGSAVFSFLGNDFAQIFGQIVLIRLKALSNPNLEALWQIKRERDSLPLDVRRSKTLLLPIYKNGQRVELVQKLTMSDAARLAS